MGRSDSEVAEESVQRHGEIFDAMVSCPKYQVVSAGAVIEMGAKETTAPDVGDEQ